MLALGFLSPFDFASPGAVLNMLGRLTGIWGLALMLVAAMLCCRVPGFDVPFGGLTKLWQLHHKLGAIGFLMILAHPLLLAIGAAEVSLNAAVATLFSDRPAVLWGWVALLALMAFMAPTFNFFGEPDYQRWKWVHRLSGITVVFALIHTLMLSRTLPGIWGDLVWGVLAVMTLSAISYRWIFSRWYGRHPYLVSKVEHPANNIVELSLAPVGTHLKYAAGQFVYLTPKVPELASGHDEEHPYTLSSAPGESVLRIAIKDLGDGSRALQDIETDSMMTVEGPYGSFFPRVGSAGGGELWIAGGIGITPFLGRLRHCARSGEALDAHLIYCVQDEGRLVFGEELQGLTEAIAGCQFNPHYFYREGPLSADYIKQRCPDFASRKVYICGPLPLIELSRVILSGAGVPSGNIVTEEFVLL
ncbi:MAG: ferredoxin reductase family protein [Pseudohongiellaceae bacterium]